MFFHITRYSIYLSFLMKLFIKKTKIYIKLDTAINGAESIVSDLTNGFFPGKHIKRWLLPRIDLISVETSVPHAFLSSNPWLKNIKLIPNGLDDDLFGQGFANLKKNKVNIITTVGRLGSYQKNTELILSIIKEVDLQDWQVFLIGSIEKQEIDFQRNIDELYKNFPHLISRVHFIGNISDTATLYNYYAQSRIFLFPSRFEASAIAELEAAIYGNYIIATDVGAARDITNNGQFGFICPESIEFKQNETKITESILQQLTRIINNEITIDDQIEKQSLFVRNNFMMSIIIKNAAFKDWAIPGIK
jgi:glycosyltransferase involved in cell wall biosynthesis